jgi:enoyl-[acyl-carrier protein] reductase II
MALATRMTELLGTTHPVMNAGMGHVAVPALVAAVSEAGGLGLLATSTLTPDEVRAAVREIRSLTDRPFGANVTLTFPNDRANAAVLIEERVAVVNLSLGIAPDLVEAVHAKGGLVISTVATPRHARSAAAKGADAVIVVGHEAAGHGGAVSTLVLVPLVRAAVDVPVIAAGGFADGTGLAAALVLGADGISMGTRFATSAESPVHPSVVETWLAASAADTLVTDRIDGLPSRVLARGRALAVAEGGPPGETVRSVRGGDLDAGVVATGQVVGRVTAVRTCKEIIESVVAEAEARLRAAPGLATGTP